MCMDILHAYFVKAILAKIINIKSTLLQHLQQSLFRLLFSVTQSRPTLCDLVDCSTPGLPVPHHLLKFAQLNVHCIGDAIQPSHPLMSSSPSAINLSQHQGLFQ